MENKLPDNCELYFYHKDIFNDEDTVKVFVEYDYEIPMHQQEFYEINVVTKGNGIHFIGDNKINVKVGDVFIVPPNVSQGYIGGKGFDVFHITMSDNFIRKYMTDLEQLPNYFTLFAAEPIMRASTREPLYLSLNEEQYKEMKVIIDYLLKFANNKHDSVSDLSRISLTIYFISTLCKIYSENQDTNDLITSSEDTHFMNSLSYIHANYNKKITIENLCEIAFLSRSTYIRKFKTICKMPPALYIMSLRLEAAKRMLTNTSYSISEIAYKTGFVDASHFTRTFEDEYNLTPTSYRKQNKKPLGNHQTT